MILETITFTDGINDDNISNELYFELKNIKHVSLISFVKVTKINPGILTLDLSFEYRGNSFSQTNILYRRGGTGAVKVDELLQQHIDEWNKPRDNSPKGIEF